MTPIQNNYYDMKHPMKIQKYNLEIVNGFATAIAVLEQKLLLCAEVSHRVISTATVYDKMCDLYNKKPTQLLRTVRRTSNRTNNNDKVDSNIL